MKLDFEVTCITFLEYKLFKKKKITIGLLSPVTDIFCLSGKQDFWL